MVLLQKVLVAKKATMLSPQNEESGSFPDKHNIDTTCLPSVILLCNKHVPNLF